MKAVLLTVHDLDSARKVDFHFWAEALAKRGYDVRFVTVGQSPLTKIRQKRLVANGPKNKWVYISDKIQKFIFYPLFHPISLHNSFLNAISTPLFNRYSSMISKDLLQGLQGGDLFIVESCAGLMLVPTLRRHFPKAKFVYSVSDRLATLPFHPVVLQSEKIALEHFNYIRIPSKYMENDYDPAFRVVYIPPGIDKKAFDRADIQNPFSTSKNAISVGDMLFDRDALDFLAASYPEWTFHLFGKEARGLKVYPNVIEHGEKPFADLVPYFRYADIGLALYHDAPEAEYICQSSLKITQYTYSGLPIVAPAFASMGQDHMFSYETKQKQTMHNAFERAIAYTGKNEIRLDALDWDEVLDTMLNALN